MAEPTELFLEHLTDAKWEIVDTHRCTACSHLDRDGHRMVEHLWTHVEYACRLQTPASVEGDCRGCGWVGPGTRGPAIDLHAAHVEHRLHSARQHRIHPCHPRCPPGDWGHYAECPNVHGRPPLTAPERVLTNMPPGSGTTTSGDYPSNEEKP